MADHDDRERVTELGLLAMEAFEIIRMLLAGLPVPVAVPDFGQTDDIAEVLFSLDRARRLLADEPIPSDHVTLLRMLMLDWFLAYDMLALAKIGKPAPWRLDAVEHALGTFGATLEELTADDDS